MTKQIDKTAVELVVEKAQETLKECEITNHFQTDVVNGRHASAVLMASGNIYIKQISHHVPGIEPTTLNLTPETFSFLLEVFLHAEKEFGIDRKKNIASLTEGSNKIEFKKSLSLYGILT